MFTCTTRITGITPEILDNFEIVHETSFLDKFMFETWMVVNIKIK